jgi:hypothetical protein
MMTRPAKIFATSSPRAPAARRELPGRVVFYPLLLVLCAIPLAAQASRGDIKIFIPRPVSRPGIYAQQDFFAEQFKMEITAANYTITDKRDEADYTVGLTVDGNEYYGQPDEKQYILTLVLTRTADNKDIVQFSWPFTEMTEMYQWNLYLVYQAMANVPLVKEIDEPTKTIIERERLVGPQIDDRWRNQWVYVNVGAGMDMIYFLIRDGENAGKLQTGSFMPTLLAGVEWHCLDFFSAELDVKPRFIKIKEMSLSAALTARVVFKFGVMMLELYGGGEYALGLSRSVPAFSVLAGLQVGTRGATRSAWVLDFGFTRNLTGAYDGYNGNEFAGSYGLTRFHILLGYKFGFKDRKPVGKEEPPAGTAAGAQ